MDDLSDDIRIVPVVKLGYKVNWSDAVTIPRHLAIKYGLRAKSYDKKVYVKIEERELEQGLFVKRVDV